MSMAYPYIPRTPPSTSYSPSPLPAYPSVPSGSGSSGSSTQAQPVTRSRTLFYLSVRDSSASASSSRARGKRRIGGGREYGNKVDVGDDEEERLIGTDDDGRGGLPPRWVDISDEVDELLGRIKPKIAALDKLHAKHVLPGFTDRTAEEREIERQTIDITRDFRKCTSLVGSIATSPRAPKAEITTAKNVQRGLAQKVQELSGMFRKKQRVYMQKLQGHAIKSKDLLVASGAITLRGPDMLDELAEDELSVQQSNSSSYQSQSLAQAPTAVDFDVETRTKEITQIAQSISELAELFRDLGNMVVEQGTVLDSVEYNVGVTAREMQGAEEELKVAQRYQANTGRRKCMLLLVLLIAGLIIVLIYKPRSTSDSSPLPSSPIPTDLSAISSEIPPDSIPPNSASKPGAGTEAGPGSVADAVAGARPWIRPPSAPGFGGEAPGGWLGDDEERWRRRRTVHGLGE